MTVDTEITTNKNKPSKFSKKRKIISTLIWLISWPLIIGVLGLAILIVGSQILFGNGQMNSPQGFQIRAMWSIYVGVLVVICGIFIWLKTRNKTSLNKISANILKTYMWIGIIIGVSITVIIPDTQVTTASAGINVQQTNALFKPELASDATINSSLAKIGATDTKWVETKFVNNYDAEIVDNQAGTYQAFIDTAGNWSYGVLTVKRGTTGNALDTVVAHEYMHHVWFKLLDEQTRIKLTSDLITIYSKDTAMQERVRQYSEKQSLQPTELFSYYCTEVSDKLLTPYILSECSKYANRSVLQFAV